MDKEKRIARMAELKDSAESMVKEYNAAMLNDQAKEAIALDAKIAEAVNEYTSYARDICFEECAAAPDPMIEAVKRLSFTTIGVKDSKVENSTIPVRELVEKERQIDILKLHKRINGGIGHDAKWPQMVEKFNLLLTCQKAQDLGIDPKSVNDSYAMSELAKAIDMGKSPTSKTNILKTLTGVVQAMIGDEYKPVSHDVNFLLSVYSRKSRKALTVTCANHKYLRGYMMEICHRIIEGKSYEIDYKKAQ